MKVTVNNYNNMVAEHGIPAKLQSFHDQLITEAAENNWAAYYADNDVKTTVDLYFEKYQALTAIKEPAPAPVVAKVVKITPEPKQPKAKPTPAPKPAKAQRLLKPKNVGNRAAAPAKPVGKSKAPKAAAPKAPLATSLGKRVKVVRPSTRYIQRFLELLNKKVSVKKLEQLLRSLQLAINQGKIKKSSPHADNIRVIQENLVAVCNKTTGMVTLTLPDKKIGELATIAGGERVYPSLLLLRRFINWTGKQPNKEQLEKLRDDIRDNLKISTAISERDPFRAKVVEIRNAINRMLKNNKLTAVSPRTYDLRGIAETLEGCDCGCGGLDGLDGDEEFDDAVAPPTVVKDFNLNGGVMTAEQMMRHNYETIAIPAPYSRLVGNPAENFTMMISGSPGGGKSTYSLAFAVALANAGKKVIYLSAEEYGSLTLQDRLQRVGGYTGNNLSFAGSLSSFNPAQYNVLFIDSLKVAKIDVEEIREIRKKYPRLAIVAVQQQNKQGQASGANDLPHEFDIVADVSEGKIRTSKNRYGALTELRIW
jgi:hypothetical protein